MELIKNTKGNIKEKQACNTGTAHPQILKIRTTNTQWKHKEYKWKIIRNTEESKGLISRINKSN